MNEDSKHKSAALDCSALGFRHIILGLIFFVVLMDTIGLTILDPIAPYIVHRYDTSALMVTILSSIYAGAQFVSAPILGKLSDRAGRRPVLLLSVLGSALGYFVFGLGGALWVLFLARLIDGITAGNIPTATAYVMDVSKPEERARNMTVIGTAFGLGFVLGPSIAGALGQISTSVPVFAAAVISLVSVTLIFFLLPESLPRERRQAVPLDLHDLNPVASIRYMLGKSELTAILLVSALFSLAFNGITSVGGLFVIRRFTAQPWQVGSFFAMAGIANVAMQALFTGRLVLKFGERPMSMIGLAGTGGGALLVVVMPALWLIYPIAFLQSAVTGFAWVTLPVLAANAVSESEQGQLAGVNGALGGLMATLGPLWAGMTFDRVAPAAPFLIGTAVLAIACVLLAQAKIPAHLAPQAEPVLAQSCESGHD